MRRPSFIEWATSPSGMYLREKREPTLAMWLPYQVQILNYLFPAGEGRLPFSEILWSEPKKHGKTLLAAALHEYFALFVETPGEQYVLANDLEGASDRTFLALKGSLEKAAQVRGSGWRESSWRQVGTKIVLENGSEIKALANDYKGGAGGNHSFATFDETWGFTTQAHLGLLTEFGPVPTRENSVTFYTGYQGYENEDPHWHRMIDSVLENGKPVPELAHIEDGEGKPACWVDGRTFLFYSHLPRMPWHTEEFLEERRRRLPEAEFQRVYNNQRVKNASPLCTEAQWDALEDKELRSLHEGDTRRFVVAVDAATKRDSCGLTAVCWDKEKRRYEQILAEIWAPSPGQPIQLTETIAPAVLRLHETGRLVGVWFDPFQMMAVAEILRKAGVKTFEFPQNQQRVASDTLLRDCIIGKNLAHYGSPELRTHILNASVKSDGERGLRIIKKDIKKPIDAAVSLGMAVYAAQERLVDRAENVIRAEENFIYR